MDNTRCKCACFSHASSPLLHSWVEGPSALHLLTLGRATLQRASLASRLISVSVEAAFQKRRRILNLMRVGVQLVQLHGRVSLTAMETKSPHAMSMCGARKSPHFCSEGTCSEQCGSEESSEGSGSDGQESDEEESSGGSGSDDQESDDEGSSDGWWPHPDLLEGKYHSITMSFSSRVKHELCAVSMYCLLLVEALGTHMLLHASMRLLAGQQSQI